MATLKVWLDKGTIIPTSNTSGLTATGSANDAVADGFYTLVGTESQIKADYLLITGFVMDKFPTSTASPTGAGHYFGGVDGNPDGES